ncbi:lycopene beta-cyclase CrtY [Sphingomonas sp.]|uniref:lycopene beta-cyclase CrtY n=1 Tax=Sphingomonas sp. TaxID=28214 RepID=UPI001E194D18|nr:lycopene beta-cyclase CrtY [Sphingomonas sp.]MBX9796288.1 lycopene beta-cyclase CrtY [Sphingomonas sp.]
MAATIPCDLAIVGGGLAGGLIALALAKKRPDLKLKLIDGAQTVGGNHLWSFFASDIADADRWIVAPLVCHGWRGYNIRFPDYNRTLDTAYYSIESERLDQMVRETLPAAALMLGRRVIGLGTKAVVLADGDRVEANGVIDARGAGDLSALELGWQKFVGREYALTEPHHVARPIVMDATVSQIDGYRFVYTLPFSQTRLFVEDTYYSDTPDLYRPAAGGSNADPIGERLTAYVAEGGWHVDHVVREEQGALPVALGGDFDAFWRAGGKDIAKAGMRAGLFHPTTGYSLPDAVRTASLIARTRDLSSAALHDLLHGHARHTWRARSFYRLLDRMLFRASAPEERYRILQHFYRLNPALVGRFYAGQTTMIDQARILTGKPPVKLSAAMRAIRSNPR